MCRVKKIAEISLVLSENEDFDGALSFRVKWKVNPAQDLRHQEKSIRLAWSGMSGASGASGS